MDVENISEKEAARIRREELGFILLVVKVSEGDCQWQFLEVRMRG